MKDAPLVEYWYMALREPHGIVIDTTHTERMMRRLFAARQEANDPDLSGLTVVLSPSSEHEVWIIHKATKHEKVD